MSSSKKRSVLIVDDERANISTLKNILSPKYIVYASSDGKNALEATKKFSPDVILLDILMPETDGYEVIISLKESEATRDIPVIFITGLDSADAEEKGFALGAADYITKPFHPSTVEIRVKNQINILERYAIENDLNVVLKLQSELIAAKELAEKNREIAEHSNRAKSEFLSRMSHEMRTPMHAIMGMMQLVKAAGVPNKLKHFFENIDASTHELLVIIDDVLDISGMEYGSFKLNNSVFNINTMIAEAIQMAKHSAATKKQTLFMRVNSVLPDSLTGDEKNLRRVITTLLSNAVKFTPDKGEISFDAYIQSEDDKTVTLKIEVADNGIGISDEQKGNLFTIFEQVDGSKTRRHGGIGIGLALSKRIVEMMDGEIWVESEPDKGSKFSFTCKLEKA